MIIAVVGESRPTADMSDLAEEVGRLLAEAGATVVCGGGHGAMAAVCRGAKAAGGTTIGILPGPDASRANEWVDIPIPTGMGQARNVIIVRTGQAVIAVGGRYGTLSEIAHALKEGVPVIGLRTWELVRNGAADDGIVTATDPQDAVTKAIAAASSAGARLPTFANE